MVILLALTEKNPDIFFCFSIKQHQSGLPHCPGLPPKSGYFWLLLLLEGSFFFNKRTMSDTVSLCELKKSHHSFSLAKNTICYLDFKRWSPQESSGFLKPFGIQGASGHPTCNNLKALTSKELLSYEHLASFWSFPHCLALPKTKDNDAR